MTNQNTALAAIEHKPALAMVNRGELAKALTVVCRTIERKNTIPVLDHARLTVSGGLLAITGTDLDINTTVDIQGAIDPDFDLLVPANELLAIIKSTDCELITLTETEKAWQEHGEPNAHNAEGTIDRNGLLTVDCGGMASATLRTMTLENWPELAMQSLDVRRETVTYSTGAADLVEAFSKCLVCVSQEESRYYLGGIYLHYSSAKVAGDFSGLLAVATDGHRLALRSIPALVPTNHPGVIIPRKTIVQLLAYLGKKPSGKVKVIVSTARIAFECDGARFQSKVIDGTFPDYNRVIPRNNDTSWIVETKKFSSAVASALKHVPRGGRSYCTKFTFGNGALQVEHSDSETGVFKTSINASGAKEIEIGFNVKYVSELCATSGPELQFLFNDAGCPTLILDASNKRGLSVLMPMRV